MLAVSSMGFVPTVAAAAITCVNPDHAIYGDADNRGIVTSCIPANTWDINMASAADLQLNGLHFNPLQSVILKDGTVEVCPFWYISGCVIAKSLVR